MQLKRCFKPGSAARSPHSPPLLRLPLRSIPAPVLPVNHFNAAFEEKIRRSGQSKIKRGVCEAGRRGLSQGRPGKKIT